MMKIGIGVGLAYTKPTSKLNLGNVDNPAPPTEDTGSSSEQESVTANNAESKSYWKF